VLPARTAVQFADEEATSALVALARIAVALDAAERGREAPLLQMLLRAGEELPWGTGEGVPADGVLELWCEITPGTSREAVDQELRAIVAGAATAGIDIAWEQRTRFLPATAIPDDAPIVQALTAAIGRTTGVGPSVGRAPFACDAFVLNEHSATPVVVYGPRGGNAHAPDEFVLIDDLRRLARVFAALAVDWCGVAGVSP